MKAAIFTRYGPPEVLQIREVERPQPGARDILVRVRASAVSAIDWRLRRANPWFARLYFGLLKPKRPIVPGLDFAGTVEAVGAAVTRFKVGDQVFGSRFRDMRLAAHAEYLCQPQDADVAPIPKGLSHETAAALVFGGTSALTFFNKAGGFRAGDEVLVDGASGSVGTYAVQLAKRCGARVTGVCSGTNADLVRSLGANRVIDYTAQDFRNLGDTYDVVVETVGKGSFFRGLKVVKPGGAYLMIAGPMWVMPSAPLLSKLSGRRIVAAGAAPEGDDLVRLADLAARGELEAVIDRRYPLDQIVEAHRYVESGRKKGNVVLVMSAGD
jgi:NADPH:quinone reductase-like Zn-dependent oxidoreductase